MISASFSQAMGIAALLFLLFTAHPAHSADAKDPAWLALIHFDGSRSSVEAPSQFFLSPTGDRDPQAELRATLAYFDSHPEEAACRFPARAIYLGRTAEGKSEFCERWGRWRTALRAQRIELVFAAAFLSSPSSMYGHTLLKFVRTGDSDDLLDYTLNYGADTGNVVGLPYVWLGLTGGFSGSYATAPFYMKVREYNFVENRDFWIYPLELSAEQVRLLVAHAWELREVAFPYYFLHKNCSYYLLEFLELARPGSRLTSAFPFWSVPVDTIRLLKKQNWLGKARFRPSRYRRLKAHRAQLQSDEAVLVDQLATTGEAGILPTGRETLLLDSAYELWRYRTESKRTDGGVVEQRLLRARSAISLPGWSPDFSAEQPPDEGHPSARAGIAYGQNRERGFAELSYRGTLHDLLADPQGYEDYSELSMGDIRVRVEDSKIFPERVDVLRLRSIAPREQWIPRSTWSFRAGLARAKEFRCEGWRCTKGGLDGGWGLAALLGPVVAFASADADFEVGSVFDRSYRLGVGPSGGLFTPLWSGARLLLEGDWRWRVMGSHVPVRKARFGLSQTFSRQWEARLQFEALRGYREGMAQLYFYF